MNKETDRIDLSGKKILIIRLSSLGDILLTTPLLRTLKKKFKGIQLDFVLKEQFKDALKLNPEISNLYLYEKEKKSVKNMMSELKRGDYDMVIDLQNNFRSWDIKRALNTINLRFKKRSFYKFLLVNFKINRLKNAFQIPLRYASAVPGLRLDEEGLDLFTENSSSASIEKTDKLIGIAPGSRHFSKMWPKEYYEKLGSLLSESGFNVVIFGGKDDSSVCSEISQKIPGSINLCNEDNLLQTAADMKKCKVVICNDSGMMHTACAVRIPVVAFFGSTVNEFGFTPYRNKNLILENNSLTCRPCSHIGREHCPKGHFKCMLEITPEKAYEAIMSFI